MKKTTTLRVRPNPFHTLDGEGMPAGVARVDPDVGRPGTVEFIGATMTKTVLRGEVVKGVVNERREPRYRRRATSIAWSDKAVEIAATDMHKQYVQTGALIAEDEATAKLCGVDFMEPTLVLAAFRKLAIADWRTHHEEDPPVDEWDAAVSSPRAAPPIPDKAPSAPARPWDALVPPTTAAPAAEVK